MCCLLRAPPFPAPPSSSGAHAHSPTPTPARARPPSPPSPPQAVVQLGDLGWSIVKRTTSKRTTLCGTMEYLPPEVCRGAEERVRQGAQIVGGMSLSEEYDESFDLYTLGALLYEMLLGHSPFAGPAFASDPGAMGEVPLMRRILAGTFSIPHWLPRDVQLLIRQLMSQNPRARPQAAAVLASPWLLRLAGPTPAAEWDY